MIDIKYRTADIDDLTTLLDFEYEIISFERAFDSNLKPDPTHYYDLKATLLSQEVEVVVAHINNNIIASGYAKIVNAKPYHINSQYAYLGFMYVKPEFRGKGVIQNIIETLLQWSKNRGLEEARLEVYNDNVNAIKAYEKVGFKKHMIEMKMYIKKN